MSARINDPFDVDSPVAQDLRFVGWDATPLGPPQHWPQSLQTVVRTLLTSRFSMWMAWGPDLTFFCNDAYRRDTLGKKYPWALGRSAREVWAEIWPDIGPRIQTVLATGDATWDEALLLFLERSGYTEETYHTFSYSPLADDAGDVVGMLCVVTEDTERVIAERRMSLLRDLGSDAAAIRNEAEFFAAVRRHLAADDRSVPFTLTYLYDDDATTASLACATGVPDGHPIAPALLSCTEAEATWPTAPMPAGGSALVDRLGDRFSDVPRGAWEQPPTQALVVPIPQQGQEQPFGFLVVGVNPYRPLDEGYLGFVDLIAGQIGAGLASARAYAAERRRADALAELDRAKTAFFTNISHEFRTPLTLLLGPAEDALADTAAPLPVEQRTRLDIVHRNALRLLKLVNSLLDFSRLEAGRLIARYEPVDLSRETGDLASTFRSAVERVGLRLEVDCAPLSQPVYLDREMWAKVVLNLLSNALKFTFEGAITVMVREADGGAEVSVRDTGTGIDPADQTHLFERFHRIAGARSRTHEGSGVGLALVAELTALHGGSVGVTSAPGEGSTFTVFVPFGAEHLPAEHVAPPAPRDIDPERAAQGYLAEAMRWIGDATADSADPGTGDQPVVTTDERPRVLVVDDNADMRDYVARLLRGSYEVTLAADGAEGLDIALADPPDLVLTDVMMPRLDGFQLLQSLRDDARTAHVPVVMLSARAGDDAMVEGLDAGADDYLVKPFAARELLARVRANLELDRVRRTRLHLERSQTLLDQAQRLAGVGSWELDLRTGKIGASEEFLRQLQLTRDELEALGFDEAVSSRVHPDDRDLVRDAVAQAAVTGSLDYEIRVLMPDAETRTFHTIGEVEYDDAGAPLRIRGSNQDVTGQREAEEALATAAAAQEAAVREHSIADELQRSLLPPPSFGPDHLDVATFYRAGVEGTHVGGDWYDVIELGAGRTALVIGDVMGRGVRAAAVMGQLRAAVRAYARLDLPPADVLEFLDAVVRDLGDDQIVTCVYAVYDPGERVLSYANAGHLPPLLVAPGRAPQRLAGASGPPLGTGQLVLSEEQVRLDAGATVALYTDGLVEHRGTDIDAGIDQLASTMASMTVPLEQQPAVLVSELLPHEPDDDIAVLLAQVRPEAEQTRSFVARVPGDESAVQQARRFVAAALTEWQVPSAVQDDIVLLTSELVTNAVIHGLEPIELRVRSNAESVVLDVRDHAAYLPRRLRPTVEDEHGRGLQLVALLADRWGTRATPEGKSVWCVFTLAGRDNGAH